MLRVENFEIVHSVKTIPTLNILINMIKTLMIGNTDSEDLACSVAPKMNRAEDALQVKHPFYLIYFSSSKSSTTILQKEKTQLKYIQFNKRIVFNIHIYTLKIYILHFVIKF